MNALRISCYPDLMANRYQGGNMKRRVRLLLSLVALVVVSAALAIPPKQEAAAMGCVCVVTDAGLEKICCNGGKCIHILLSDEDFWTQCRL